MQTLFLCLISALPMSHAQLYSTGNGTAFVGWQAEPGVRGTWSILSSCVATLLLCAYTTLHINILWKPGFRRRAQRLARLGSSALIVPEILVAGAWDEWHEAHHLTKTMTRIRKDRQASYQQVPKYMKEWSMTHSFFIRMGGIILHQADPESSTAYLTPDGLIQLVREHQDIALAVLDKEAIEDRSKADVLTKSVTLLQASHMVLLVIARLAARKTVSALEFLSCAQVPMAIILMSLWWHKPYNAQNPIVLTVQNSVLNNRCEGHYECIERNPKPSPDQLVYTTTKPQVYDVGRSTIGSNHPTWSSCLAFLGSFVFAGFHLFLWNAHFPSPTERWIWRVSCIYIAAAGLVIGSFRAISLTLYASEKRFDRSRRSSTSPLSSSPKTEESPSGCCHNFFLALLIFIVDWFLKDSDESFKIPRVWTWIRNRIYCFLIGVYVAARLYIVVESFISLRSLPADAYIVPTWTSIIPNFG